MAELNQSLLRYGWDTVWQEEFSALEKSSALAAGRVAQATRNYCQLLTAGGEVTVRLPGRFRHQKASKTELPAVGDWVAFKPGSATREGSIQQVLTRRSLLLRKAPGHRGSLQEQAIAANVDTVFIVAGLDRDYNLRRIERYLTLVYHSGARPVLVLNKADLCPRPEQILTEVREVAPGIDCQLISALDQATRNCLASYLEPGKTIACIGSSGAGKSTLINCLLGYDRQATGALSETLGKGMHTTTHRELIPLAGGAMLIDNPGMRELQPQADAADLSSLFDEIDRLAGDCRYHNCQHANEPDCAVKQAVASGTISEDRYHSFIKLQQEMTDREQRQSLESTGNSKRGWKPVSKALKKKKQAGWIDPEES